MKLGLYLATMRRESRGARGRLVFFTACLAIGVAAVTGVTGSVAAIEDGVRAQARDILAADVVVSSRQELPELLFEYLDEAAPEHRRTGVHELATMVSAPAIDGGPGRSRLVELKVLDGPFPYYGELVLEPAGRLDELLTADTLVVAPDLLTTLGVEVGDSLRLGGQDFSVAAAVVEEPSRLGFSFTMGPRVFVSKAGIDRTPLLQFGSRVRRRAMVALPAGTTRDELVVFTEALEQHLRDAGERLSVESWNEAQPSVRRALGSTERFLGLVALLSLLLGGIGVAQIVRAWLAGRTEAVAVLRCLGFRPREILGLYLTHVAALAVVGSLAGGLLGALFPLLIPRLAPDLVPAELVVAWQPLALARGVGMGLAVALVFSLPPLTALWRVSPARVLQAAAAPLPPNRRVRNLCLVVLVAGVFGAAWAQGQRLDLAAGFTVGLGVTALALAGGAKLVMGLVGRLPRERISPYLRTGLSALARPGAGTVGAVTALGLGVLVVTTMSVVTGRLDEDLANVLPDDAPSAFMVDIQPDQWDGVRGALEQAPAVGIDSVPVVMARLAAIDGVGVREINERRDGRPRWVLTREQRLTWMDTLPPDNEIVDGALWQDDGVAELSLEQGYAEDLHAEVGTVLTLDVQGVPMDLTVTSIRTVDWESFGINFFLVVEPGVLEEAPHFRIAVARLDPPAESAAQDALAASYPNVTFISVRAIIEKVLELVRSLAAGVRLLGSFTILTGVIVLAGAIASTSLRRGKEAALLKTLGVTRRGVVALFAAEYALCGLVAGAIGGVGALALSWGFLVHVAEVDYLPSPVTLLLSMAIGAVLAVLCGIAASRRALSAKPAETLRG